MKVRVLSEFGWKPERTRVVMQHPGDVFEAPEARAAKWVKWGWVEKVVEASKTEGPEEAAEPAVAPRRYRRREF